MSESTFTGCKHTDLEAPVNDNLLFVLCKLSRYEAASHMGKRRLIRPDQAARFIEDIFVPSSLQENTVPSSAA